VNRPIYDPYGSEAEVRGEVKKTSNIFVTGTDTGVGKTVVSAWICKQAEATYWKPIQTGCELDSDSATVALLAKGTNIRAEKYRLRPALSPYDAAYIDRVKIDKLIFFEDIPDRTVVEGAGGILVPISDGFSMIDLAEATHSSVLIVAKSKLGFLNHIFMTVNVLNGRGIPVIGIVLIGGAETFLIKTIEKFSGVRVLLVLPIVEDIDSLISETPLPEEIKLALS
jgi:dethiobiotin synthetase/malonyl-CoA O-methyltransferase